MSKSILSFDVRRSTFGVRCSLRISSLSVQRFLWSPFTFGVRCSAFGVQCFPL